MKKHPNRRAPSDDEKLPFRFEHDEEGKLHLHVDTDLTIHYHGNKAEEVEGTSVKYIDGDDITVTKGISHTNPWGAEYYDDFIEHILKNPDVRNVMEAKLQFYKQDQRKSRLNKLKEKLFKYNFNRRIRKKDCDCE